MINSVRSKISRIVTQINNNEFLVEGEIECAKFGFQVDESFLNFADIQGGPFLHIGQDFFGKGNIKNIQKIDSGKDDYLILKITIDKE
jgi:hypothetical protein